MKRENFIKKETGMTIVEMMISVSILAIVVAAAIGFITFSQKQFMWIDTDARIQSDMRLALEHMTINIKDSEMFMPGSDTNFLILCVPNLDDIGSILGYDTIIYKVDPSDITKLQLELVQTPTSRHNGWGKKVSEVYDAGRSETVSTWIMLDKIANPYDTSPIALFSYTGDTIVLSYNYTSIYSVKVNLQITRESTPGKYQTKTLSTSVRTRNSF